MDVDFDAMGAKAFEGILSLEEYEELSDSRKEKEKTDPVRAVFLF